MELYYVIPIFICILVSLLILHKRKTARGGTGPLPPGKTGWPILGESVEFLSAGWKGHPEKFIFDRIAKYSSPVFRTNLFGKEAVVFAGAAGNKFLFSNENKLVRAWWPSIYKIFPSLAQTSFREEAIRMRKMLTNFLKSESLQRYVGVMDHLASRHFADRWENRTDVVVYPLSKKYTLLLACRLFVSIEDPAQVERLAGPVNDLASGLFTIPVALPGTSFNRAIKCANTIRKELISIIRQRKIDLAEGKASPMQDILSHVLSASGELMHELSVADKILGLILGGHDTASSACAVVVNYLAELPQIYEEVYKEQMEIANSKEAGELLNWKDIHKMKYSWNVVCEVLRLAPPLQGGFKEAITDFTYNGFSIPKGWKLYWSANSTHTNPEFFPDPKKFDPSRFEGTGPAPYTFVPFGGGPSMCPGIEYARLEILVFLHHLVKRFKWQKMIPDEKIVVNPLPIPAKGLPVRLYPHPKN